MTALFPKDFFWGASTSAHQIEGGLVNDWSEWERSEKRKKELEKKGHTHTDFISGHAANSFVEFNADVAALVTLGVKAYRFSVDWSRIEPTEGQFDKKALEYYRTLIVTLRSHGIEPFVTLWHWPIPLWMRDQGGFTSRRIVPAFRSFVRTVAQALHTEVHFWIPLNEPMVYSTMAYLKGEWPPKHHNPWQYMRVIHYLTQCHKAAYEEIKKIDTEASVGVAKHNIAFEAVGNSPINRLLKYLADWWWNKRFLTHILPELDFIGLNYYFHSAVDVFGAKHVYERVSDLSWGLHPEGLYQALTELRSFEKPIYITEHGLADRGDNHRSWYIRESLLAVHRAITEGLPVKGYFHWSLIDNFEWAHGFHPRFGLFEVDFQTFQRTPRPSAEFYADICKNNRVE